MVAAQTAAFRETMQAVRPTTGKVPPRPSTSLPRLTKSLAHSSQVLSSPSRNLQPNYLETPSITKILSPPAQLAKDGQGSEETRRNDLGRAGHICARSRSNGSLGPAGKGKRSCQRRSRHSTGSSQRCRRMRTFSSAPHAVYFPPKPTDSPLSQQAAQFAQDHPVLTGVMVTGAAIAVAPQVVTGTALSAAGFGPGGIVASQFNPSVSFLLSPAKIRPPCLQ
jgi:hypothetical protein